MTTTTNYTKWCIRKNKRTGKWDAHPPLGPTYITINTASFNTFDQAIHTTQRQATWYHDRDPIAINPTCPDRVNQHNATQWWDRDHYRIVNTHNFIGIYRDGHPTGMFFDHTDAYRLAQIFATIHWENI